MRMTMSLGMIPKTVLTRIYTQEKSLTFNFVIMLVIDEGNGRVLLSKQSRFVPRMWMCLAGFLESGQTLEEAVRRETWEETGIEVGEVVYHSSQPWPEKHLMLHVAQLVPTHPGRVKKHEVATTSTAGLIYNKCLHTHVL